MQVTHSSIADAVIYKTDIKMSKEKKAEPNCGNLFDFPA
jgi:hypothetical protein